MANMQRNHLLRHVYVGNASHPTSYGARIVPPHLLPYQEYQQQYPLHIPRTQPHAFILPSWQNRAYIQPRQSHAYIQPPENRAYMQSQQNRGSVMVSNEVRHLVYTLLQEGDMNVYQPSEETGTDDATQGAGIPTAKHALESLPNYVVLPPHEEAAECVICMDEMCDEDQEKTITELPCGHTFHRDCIVFWLCNHNTCPICRYEMPADETTLEAER